MDASQAQRDPHVQPGLIPKPAATATAESASAAAASGAVRARNSEGQTAAATLTSDASTPLEALEAGPYTDPIMTDGTKAAEPEPEQT